MPRNLLDDGSVVGQWWRPVPAADRILCELCPRACQLKPGDRGFCFVRENRDGKMVLSTYGRSTGFCIDPIEKKPLHHFYPGTSVLSFGTAGCNLGCKFCQNWEISKSRQVEQLSQQASPSMIAQAAVELGCRSVAFTYNDPVVWAEYAIDTAEACRQLGVKTVAVTAGYLSAAARPAFFQAMDAANVDLKGFTEDFYWKVTGAHLSPVLETLLFLKRETNVWFEITNLVIPQVNDDPSQIRAMSDWILEHLGPDVPIHFSAFHPDFRMQDQPPTPPETLAKVYEIARGAGMRYVYVGNVHDRRRQQTYCPQCQACLIERDWYELGAFKIHDGCCQQCRSPIAGHFENTPGTWGRKRQPVTWNARSQTQPLSTPLYKVAPMTKSISTGNLSSRLDSAALTDEQRQSLLAVAARWICRLATNAQPVPNWLAELGELQHRMVYGVFTTLKRGSLLRGCCGSIGQPRPLGEQLLHACRRTVLEDARMPAISPYELPYLHLDLSLLDPLEPIAVRGRARLVAFELGKHGLHIRGGERGGLLLPSVSVEQGWDAEQFLRGVCRKTGLPETAWETDDTSLQRFAGTVLASTIPEEAWRDLPRVKPRLLDPHQLRLLQGWVVANLTALARHATPSYFQPEIPDGNIHGLILSLFTEVSKRPLWHMIKLSLRPGMALQSTLFGMTQAAYEVLQRLRSEGDIRVEIGVTVLEDPAAHGHLQLSKKGLGDSQFLDQIRQQLGLEGLPGAGRALVCMTGPEAVVVSYDPEVAPAFQVMDAARKIGFHEAVMSVYSMAITSTRPMIVATNLPMAKASDEDRSPAVAGRFYPAEDGPRKALVADIFSKLPAAVRVDNRRSSSPAGESYRDNLLAIMTPHAGLTFSGRLAALAWREVDFRRPCIIIGPKHTAEGVAWAVAPCRHWKLSAAVSMDSDYALAEKLVQQIDGLRFDAVAHQHEHAIEVQLPIIEYLTQHPRVVGVALQGGGWERIASTARCLARLLRDTPVPPLLAISSDMNHYASDQENRRRDRLALDAIHAKDPQRLLRVCREHDISMCGLLPAAIVLQTLHELGEDYEVEELGYATSGEVHPSEQVVGYAALAFRRVSN
jgi:AmmeMemoRadiSam system radical SAM enzyme/AmmeMemoRadiSam system protein B/AmmeMemoRadiSam system protein A